MSEHVLGDRGQALEDAFFKRQEADRIKAMKAEVVRQKSVEALSEVSGIADMEILQHLVDLGVTAEAIAAVSLVPLIHVAWADGEVQENERDAILEAAKDKGVEPGKPAYALLKEWLGTRPTDNLFSTWRDYVESLTAALSENQVEQLRTQVLGLAREVAQSAGGILGIHKVSSNERDALDAIGRAFER